MASDPVRRARRRARADADTDTILLSNSGAACFEALRNGIERKTQIAIASRLDLRKTSAALEKLEILGLANRDARNRWRPTKHGASCRYKAVPDRRRRGSDKPGRGGQRLLNALTRPMRGHELAARLGVSTQRIHQLVIKLHARGYVRLADASNLLLLVARSNDPTVLLSRAEERALSVFPDGFATSAAKLRLAAQVPGEVMNAVLARFLAEGLVEQTRGLRGDTLYRVSAAGLAHPQRGRSFRCADPPRLPVESDRVLAVLSHIAGAGQLRARDVSGLLDIPFQSTNALFQHLKRKSLVQKSGQDRNAPYALTENGRNALAEMIRRRAV